MTDHTESCRHEISVGDDMSFDADIDAYLAAHGRPHRVDLLLPDMHGRMRGKSMPGAGLEKLAAGDVRLCWGTQALNIWGVDVEGTGVGAEIGDPDGIILPVAGTLVPVPHAGASRAEDGAAAAQVLVTMAMPDGSPCFLDPRARFVAVLERYTEKNWTPVTALEVEFYLVATPSEADGWKARPATIPGGMRTADDPQVYDMDLANGFRPLISAIEADCAQIGLPIDGMIAEYGPGQFEINLKHCDDAARSADHAVLFRYTVREAARRHGLHATFMAKPYGDQVGSGCHVHASIVDDAGENIFSAAGSEASARLQHAIGGCLATAPALTAIFAPHLNSYRRYVPGAFAPAQCNWAHDHRDAAIRVPETTGPGARLEHRLAGADVNPYLLSAAVLGGMLHGIENEINPGPRVADHAREIAGERLTCDWSTAIEQFAASDIAGTLFGEEYRNVYAAGRRSELAAALAHVTDFEYATYLPRI
ncbi:MAG: glutamine synthetase family protein [Pseudomonadota bacterium]